MHAGVRAPRVSEGFSMATLVERSMVMGAVSMTDHVMVALGVAKVPALVGVTGVVLMTMNCTGVGHVEPMIWGRVTVSATYVRRVYRVVPAIVHGVRVGGVHKGQNDRERQQKKDRW